MSINSLLGDHELWGLCCHWLLTVHGSTDQLLLPSLGSNYAFIISLNWFVIFHTLLRACLLICAHSCTHTCTQTIKKSCGYFHILAQTSTKHDLFPGFCNSDNVNNHCMPNLQIYSDKVVTHCLPLSLSNLATTYDETTSQYCHHQHCLSDIELEGHCGQDMTLQCVPENTRWSI